jgi:hypothetical protein
MIMNRATRLLQQIALTPADRALLLAFDLCSSRVVVFRVYSRVDAIGSAVKRRP